VKEIKERVFAPMRESRTLSWQELEDVLQRTLTEGMGPVRSEWGMKKAWQNLTSWISGKIRSVQDLS